MSTSLVLENFQLSKLQAVKLDDDNIIPLLGVCDGYYKNNDVSLQKA
jgi:hypothetical protein